MDASSGGYKYDVFLSYSRKGQWEAFVDDVFEPIFLHWLGEELGRTPVVFKDRTTIHIGQNWHELLEHALQSSRVMVALWSRQYFSSESCRRELSFMLARAHEFRIRGVFDRIILPATIHDGNRFPPFLSVLQALNLSEYADPFMAMRSILQEKLSAKLQNLSRDAASAIEAVPNDSFQWKVDYASHLAMFSEFRERQDRPPSLGGAA